MNNPIIIRQPVFNNNKEVVAYDISISEDFIEEGIVEGDIKKINNIPRKINKKLKNEDYRFFRDETILFPFKPEKIVKDNLEELLFVDHMGWIINNNLKLSEKSKEKLKKLKSAGAKIILENIDCIDDIKKELINIVDIISIDIDEQQNNNIKSFIERTNFKYDNIKFLAKNVNTVEEHKVAKHIGFNYYQGIFFKQPDISNDNIPGYQINYLSVLHELNKEDLDFNEIKEIIEKDMAMSKSLLKTINAAYHGYNISSIKKASVMLGIRGLRKWSMIYLVEALKASKPDILFINALTRAEFAQRLTKIFNIEENLDQYFIMGMFSMLDVFMDTDKKIILEEIGVGEEMKEAILYKIGEMGEILEVAEKFDKADVAAIRELKDRYPDKIGDIYNNFLEAVDFAYKTFTIMHK